VGLLAGACWLIFVEKLDVAKSWGYIAVAASLLFWRVFFVNTKGYVMDVENDTLTFPGGGIAADSFFSYFNPVYWLQRFRRHQIPLSAIREVEAYQDTSSKTDKLDISGDFGAVSFNFFSKGKRDQLYSAIVQINEMGSPMLRR